jgi:hypothetical protein
MDKIEEQKKDGEKNCITKTRSSLYSSPDITRMCKKKKELEVGGVCSRNGRVHNCIHVCQ